MKPLACGTVSSHAHSSVPYSRAQRCSPGQISPALSRRTHAQYAIWYHSDFASERSVTRMRLCKAEAPAVHVEAVSWLGTEAVTFCVRPVGALKAKLSLHGPLHLTDVCTPANCDSNGSAETASSALLQKGALLRQTSLKEMSDESLASRPQRKN